MDQPTFSLTRRDLLKLGGTALAVGAAAAVSTPGAARAQTPKRGGTFRLRSHVAPVHFDPHQTIAFSTMIPLSFAYSRLVKVKGGSSVVPGTQPVEADLAESWERQGDTVYVFKLKKGVRWHNKPPVNGRELTAEDVKYTYERFLTIKGNPNKTVLGMVDKVEAVDKYTVKFTLSEPNAWFIDRLASTTTWIGSKHDPSCTWMNEKPAFESRRVRTQPSTVTGSPTPTLPARSSLIVVRVMTLPLLRVVDPARSHRDYRARPPRCPPSPRLVTSFARAPDP